MLLGSIKVRPLWNSWGENVYKSMFITRATLKTNSPLSKPGKYELLALEVFIQSNDKTTDNAIRKLVAYNKVQLSLSLKSSECFSLSHSVRRKYRCLPHSKSISFVRSAKLVLTSGFPPGKTSPKVVITFLFIHMFFDSFMTAVHIY